tara:strand:+ start:214 stop:426 length:213 start_codon:yes stop_codon:yes gene_type:complete
MSDKLTKKDLQAKIEDLEKELTLYKTKTQLARNYDIVCAEVQELRKKHKKNCKPACGAVEEVKEEEDAEA